MNANEKKILDLDEYVLRGETLPDIQAIGGEKWFPLETSMEEDIPVFWGGDFGVSSECNLSLIHI